MLGSDAFAANKFFRPLWQVGQRATSGRTVRRVFLSSLPPSVRSQWSSQLCSVCSARATGAAGWKCFWNLSVVAWPEASFFCTQCVLVGSLSEKKAAGTLYARGLAFSLPWRFTDTPSHNLEIIVGAQLLHFIH